MSRRQRTLRAPAERPTYRKILDHTIRVLNEDGFDLFNVQRVLDDAEVSRATLYRHFPDVDSLIETALIEIFHTAIFRNLGLISDFVTNSSDFETFREATRNMFRSVGALPPEVRLRRAHIIALAKTRPALEAAITPVQEELTNGWVAVVEDAQRRGFVREDLDTRAVAVMIQSITIGRIVDDTAITQLTNEQWANAAFDYFDRAILDHSR